MNEGEEKYLGWQLACLELLLDQPVVRVVRMCLCVMKLQVKYIMFLLNHANDLHDHVVMVLYRLQMGLDLQKSAMIDKVNLETIQHIVHVRLHVL